MAIVDISCPVEKNNEHIVLLSPSVGLVKLLIKDQQPLVGGQPIFELWRLNTCFRVHLPQDLCGIAAGITNDLSFYVAFHDKICELQPLERAQKKSVAENAKKAGEAITSPMDGMFYLRPGPDQDPLVQIGQRIEPGQTIGLIEVMKCFYPLKFAGKSPAKLRSILINNASPVSLGSQIFLVESVV